MYSIHPKVENENVFFIIRKKLTIQKSMHFAEYFSISQNIAQSFR